MGCEVGISNYDVIIWYVSIVGEASAYAKYTMACLRLAMCDLSHGFVVMMFGTF